MSWSFLTFSNSLFALGVGQYYQAFAQAGRVEVFTDRAEAIAWLNEGVPPEKALV